MNKLRNGLSVLACTSALAALTLCGCGDVEAESAARQPEFAPVVCEGTALALGANLDKEQAFKFVDAYAECFLRFFRDAPEKVQEVRDEIAVLKQDPFKDLPADFLKFLEDSGLRDAAFRWATLSLNGRLEDVFNENPKVGGIALAVSTDVDLEKVITTFRKSLSENGDESFCSFEEVELEGERAWRFVPGESYIVKALEKADAEPCIASLDGKLVLAALSQETLRRQIRLYRKGEGKGDALGDFTAATGDFVRLRLSGIGGLIQASVPDSELHPLSKMLPNGPEIVKRLKALDLDIKLEPDGMSRDSIALMAASDEDAEQIRTCLLGLLTMARMAISKDPNVPKEMLKHLDTIKIEGTANKVEIRNVDLVMAAMGAMLPAISKAVLAANTSAMAMNGSKLFIGLIQTNVERETYGLAPVWPHTYVEEGANTEDISGKAFTSAAEYFSDLFNVANYGGEEWAPYLNVDMDTLGKDVVKGDVVNIGGIDWCIAANVTETMPDCIPVLVSANFNPALLLSKWDGSTDGDRQLPIGPESGAAKSLFGDEVVVFIYKGGATSCIKKSYLDYNTIYSRQAFDVTNEEKPLMYLTPGGIAEPAGHQ